MDSTGFDDILNLLYQNNGKGKDEERNTSFGERDINALRGEAEIEALKIDNKIKSETLESKKQDREERKKYAMYSLYFLTGYMALVFAILFLAGFKLLGFELSNAVLIALITTTTANVIGIFAFVMMYLFNPREHKTNKA